MGITDYVAVEDWFERFDLMVITNEKIMDANKVAFLLTYIALCKNVYILLKELAYLNTPSTLTIGNVKKYILDHVKPKNYETHERAIFNSLVRKLDMPINEFLLKLKHQAMKCNLGNQFTITLQDRLVAGINDENIEKKLLTEAKLFGSLDSAEKYCYFSFVSVTYSKDQYCQH